MNNSFGPVIRVSTILLAGMCGGLAEVIWIAVASSILGVEAAPVAQQVAVTILPAAMIAIATPALGLVVHFGLSIALAALFAVVIRYRGIRDRSGSLLRAALVLLSAVWALNFLWILPWLNPVFPVLLPPAVTFTSKLLFALALWGVFAIRSRKKREPENRGRDTLPATAAPIGPGRQ